VETELLASGERLKQESGEVGKLISEWCKNLAALDSEVVALRTQFHERNHAYKGEEEKGRSEQVAITSLQKELEQSQGRLLELMRLISLHRNETVRLTSLTVRHEEAAKSKDRELQKTGSAASL